MKITSQLALSQIKLNKKRTIGTISAIAFSEMDMEIMVEHTL